MLVRQAMSTPVITVRPQTSVATARRLLARHGIRHLPVLAGGRVVGMLSDRDLVVRDQVLVRALDILQSELAFGGYRQVGTLMSAPVLTVEPDATLSAAAALLRDAAVGAVPVVAGGRLVGILTTTDCLQALQAPEQAQATTVAQLLVEDPDRYLLMPAPPGAARRGRCPGPPERRTGPPAAHGPRREPEREHRALEAV